MTVNASMRDSSNAIITVKDGANVIATTVAPFDKNKVVYYDAGGYAIELAFNGSGVKAARVIGVSGDVYYDEAKDVTELVSVPVPPSMTVDEDGTVWNSGGNAPPGHNRGDAKSKADNPNSNNGADSETSADALKGEHIYTYDANNRVTSGTVAGKKTTYTYDSLGNLITEKFFNGHSEDYQYNSLNQLVKTVVTNNDPYSYQYDKRGNRLSDVGKKENKKYVYSLENQLVEGTNWKSDKSAYSYNALGIRVNNKQTTHSGNVYDRDYVIDYTTVYGIAPTVQNYVLPGDISTPADGWQNDTKTNGFDIGKMLANLGAGFNTLRENGAYIFVYDYLNNILAVNGKTGTAADAEAAKAEDVKLCINDFINHFLGRTVDNSHIIGIGDNDHKLQGYAKMGVGNSDAAFGDTFASFKNSDIMVISPNYFDQKHIYTDRGQRVEQKTDTAANQNGNGGNIKKLYVHEDIMGNTRYHTKDNGQSYAELEYDVWGNPTSPNMLLNNDNGVFIFAQFTGHIYDTVLDIYFAEARFYDAKNRQWLSSDPMKDGLNWYQYCKSNPASWIDPSGLSATKINNEYFSLPSTCNGMYLRLDAPDLTKIETFQYGSGGIVLLGSNDQKDEILKYLNQLTNYELNYGADGKVYILGYDEYPKKLPKGNALIESLLKANNTVYIRPTKNDDNQYTYATRGTNIIISSKKTLEDLHNFKGTDARIDFDTEAVLKLKLQDPNTQIAYTDTTGEKTPIKIQLAHELIHADRMVNGREEKYDSKEVSYLDGDKLVFGFRTVIGLGKVPSKETERININELQVLGIGKYDVSYVSENQIRQEQGIDWLRVSHQ